ncbi:IS5-like element ISC1058 family transposase [Saccharolobus solfataricus]|uniref:Transposase ISC1058 n=2 Tax=Saccharolobus solfataricus TaxID=2287 RepID=Q7LX34_SACS2|nr:IS5-like element ISC1058 family transposase [Saccharolobus solfataricus]AAK41450.1 Transposase ISC1058 [Saccharolobus solfataricus P2]AAK41459.1 Transposase ISC1058 [Saccharolobus solfataricus P2]AAK43156.1 Transposase ISC1058 [Saccharolobus solfataricus P2]QPG48896.1 IS5-like element ISC1058 family transposase [Saccharolobus solfataricus]QPG48898.1 IS5-like element ISC1058 family transposase [Saccharolobus solfataricus]
MEKSKYKRDWSKYDENVITRYKLMFPFYVFEHWWDLLAEENRNARTKYKAPKEFDEFLAFLHIFLPYRAIEGVLRALEQLKIIPTSLDYSTIWKRVRNMKITFPEASDELEVIADATGISTNTGGQYIVAKWGKTRDSKFLKIEIVMDNNEFNVINAEVTSNEVESAVKTVKDLQDKGKKVKKFYGDKTYDANEVYKTGVEVVVPPKKNASTKRGHLARRKAVREFRKLGYDRWREEKGYGVRWRVESLFSAVKRTFGESVRATSFAGQVVEAKLKFWAYAWMVHLANSVVGRAPGIRV